MVFLKKSYYLSQNYEGSVFKIQIFGLQFIKPLLLRNNIIP